MDILKQFATDPDLENKGTWLDLGDDASMRVLSVYSKEAKAVLLRIEGRNKKYARTGSPVPDALQIKNDRDLCCVLVPEWKGVLLDDATLECTQENKETVFGDPRMRQLRQLVIGFAVQADSYRADAEAADAKNSKTASPLASN